MKSKGEPRDMPRAQGPEAAAVRGWSLPGSGPAHRAHLPDRQALRRNAKAKDRAARDPTRARPSTPLPGGRELRGHTRGVVRGVSQRKVPQQIKGIISAGTPTKMGSAGVSLCGRVTRDF